MGSGSRIVMPHAASASRRTSGPGLPTGPSHPSYSHPHPRRNRDHPQLQEPDRCLSGVKADGVRAVFRLDRPGRAAEATASGPSGPKIPAVPSKAAKKKNVTSGGS